MWPNNGVHGHGGYHPHMGGGNYQHNFDAGDGFIPFLPDGSDPQFRQQSSQMHYQNQDGDSYMPDFQPEIGLYNAQQFMQNSYYSVESPERFAHVSNTPQVTTRPGPELDARTRELKAKLMEGMANRAQSGTPPVAPAATAKSSKNAEGDNSLRQSPISPIGKSPSTEMGSIPVTAEDVEDLLSEHRPAANKNLEQESTQGISSSKAAHHQQSQSPLKVHALTPVKLNKANGIHEFHVSKTPNGKTDENVNSGEASDADEGEICDDRQSNTAPGGNEILNPSKLQLAGEKVVSKTQKEEIGSRAQNQDARGTSSKLYRSPLQSSRAPPRYQDQRYDSSEVVSSGKTGGPNVNYERKSQQIHERRSQQDDERRQHRDYEPRPLSRRAPEDQRKHEIKYEGKKKEVAPRKQDIPTLAQLLVVDEDLKEWLEITGYHNREYRDKTLNRRRALAALDAQRAKMDAEREKILQELEKEERGGGLLAGSAPTQSLPAPMLPPPFPNKTNASLPKPYNETAVENAEGLTRPETGAKRNYQDYRGSHIEDNAEKSGRLDEEGRGFRIKSENDGGDRRSNPGGFDQPQRRSSTSDSKGHRQADSETSYHNEDRSQGRGRGSDREVSPGLQAFHDRPPARAIPHDWHEQTESRDDDGGEERRDSRPYMVIGNYRGRDFDPNYKGRGRGRGNWTHSHNDRDQNTHQSQQQRNPEHWRTYGQRIANGAASKGLIKWDKGGKGETRYFIVKSFNEENVIRCIQDSIWTTQVQNGEIFEDAYNNCKNVILVFSINQSRAFQGYARMGGLPGSEEAPTWQKGINWESAGAFKVSWITIASTRFSRVGHLKNGLNEGQAVLIGKDGQEIEERCAEELIKLIDEEAERQISGAPYPPSRRFRDPDVAPWDD